MVTCAYPSPVTWDTEPIFWSHLLLSIWHYRRWLWNLLVDWLAHTES